MMKTVGIVGLGPMGGNVAVNLLEKQFCVCGFDLKPDCTSTLADKGLSVLGSATEVSAVADVVLTSLPNFEALNSVIEELCQNPKEGQVVIECSTLTVEQKITAHDQLKDAGMILLDAPISATPPMLAKGIASIHISGEEAAYKDNVAVLEGFTASNFYVGEVGNGTRMKILANYLVHVHTCAAAEVMVLGQKAGLDPALIHEVLCQSAGASKMLEIRGAMMAQSDYREGGGTMFAVYEKDAEIITQFGAEVKGPVDLYVSARQRFNMTMAQGLDHLDTSAVCKGIEAAYDIDREMAE
mgnify:CR=1 FL=1